MTQLTFKSPGVSTREIDLSGPTAIQPIGVPAGVVGTAVRGPAFVPITVATFQDFISKFGNTDGEKFGPLAMNEWLRNANAGTYVRLLGIGDGKKRTSAGTNAGSVTNAGFVAGAQQVQDNGMIGHNPHATFVNTAQASIVVTIANVGDLANLDAFTVNVPVVDGGEGITTIAATSVDPVAAANTIGIQVSENGSTKTKEDRAELLTRAINGVPTVAATKSPSDETYDGNEIKFALAGGRGTEGIKGLTATRVGDAVTIVADQVGTVGTSIVFTDTVGDAVVTNFAGAASPASLSGTTTRTAPLGRSYVLGAFVSESNGSTILSDAGLSNASRTAAAATVTLSTTDGDAIHGLTAGQKITLIDQAGTMVDYFVSDTGDSGIDNGLAVADGATLKSTGAITASRTAGSAKGVAVGFDLSAALPGGTDQAEFLNLLKDAIEGATGHAGTITVGDDLVAADGIQDMVLTQGVVGLGGNTAVVENLGTITISGNFTGGTDTNTPICAVPIIRGVVMAASGVALTLGTEAINNADNIWKSSPYLPGGSPFGDIDRGSSKQEFAMILNGHKVSDTSAQIITASFDPHAPNYFAKIFNTDPTKIEDTGHYLYTSYDVYQTQLVATASGVTGHNDIAGRTYEAAFLLSGSEGHNSGFASSTTKIGTPNFEGFEDRYKTAYSPFIISQKFGGRNKNLFKVHALDDGRAGSDAFKITIENIQASTNENNPYGRFDLAVRFFADSDAEPVVLERFSGLDLNPSSDNFIARRIGDTHTYYDFDKAAGGQKLVIDGTYPNISNYIRIELSADLRDEALNDTAIPVGFRGLNHLVTSGSAANNRGSILSGTLIATRDGSFTHANGPQAADLANINQLPVPFREAIFQGTSTKKIADAKLTWGVQFETKDSLTTPNKHQKLNESIRSFGRYFGDYHTAIQPLSVGGNEGTADVGGCVLDADRYNNNLFTLERVQVITGSGNRPDSKQWAAASYRRGGTLKSSINDIDGSSTTKTRFLDPATDFGHLPSRKYLKFTFPLQGGFDGVDVFNKDKSRFSDNALRREMDDSSKQGGTDGPTVAGYRKAIKVMEEKSDVDIQLLAIPGVRHESVTDFAIESVERRFDAMYIMDIEERDTLNKVVTGSNSVINVTNTANRHAARNFDTSFAAAYFPDVVINDPSTKTNVQCPPSVAVLGALGFNDAIAHPWFAPAGFNRGALTTTIEEQVKLNRSNLDSLYDVDINPITSFPSTPGVVIWGQKTMLAAQSALDRVNVRRLLIDVRRQVKNVANSLLFEPNRESTLSKFSNAVTPILSRIQQQQGLDRFRVQIDTTTTTQADVENNTIRGKIFLQPTRSVEFISLDFVVTNAGTEI